MGFHLYTEFSSLGPCPCASCSWKRPWGSINLSGSPGGPVRLHPLIPTHSWASPSSALTGLSHIPEEIPHPHRPHLLLPMVSLPQLCFASLTSPLR